MGIFIVVVIIAVVVLFAFRYSRYGTYFHFNETPISAKQWLDMTHEQKTDYIFRTMLLAFEYYHEEPISWMASLPEPDLDYYVRDTDKSSTKRLNDTTFGRFIRIALFDTIKQMLSAVREGKVAGPKLTGKEWLSWPLEKKKALVANYMTISDMAIGGKKKYSPDEVSMLYIESFDKAAKKNPDGSRLHVYIGYFFTGINMSLIKEFKKKQATKS